MSKSKHVVKNGNKWSVKSNGEIVSNHRTQSTAIKSGRSQAIKDKTELVIHGRDGKIREKNSYGNDPCPPKDKK